MSGAAVTASSRAALRYDIGQCQAERLPDACREDKFSSRETYHLLSHGVVFRHPSLILPGYWIDQAMIIDDFRQWYKLSDAMSVRQ